ncbi:uncharacterized protein LODBEIA_P58680 [Lodderomyces beijingensis]|uniref:Amidohydrolase-related domain-containing protein n=1 Tax=Lodderomyces beijingensis TaxID=1775926 RepID=A0ABP0ZUQ7_9ASCO
MPAAVAENPKIKATSAIPYTLYFGTFIHTPELTTSEICFNTLVGVDSRGEIDYIEKDFEPADGQSPVEYFKEQKKMSCQPQGGSEIDDENIVFVDYTSEPAKFFFPGFIDTHIHASQFPNIGIGLDTPLLDWLNTYTFPLELQFSVKDQSEQEAKFKFAKHVYSKVIQATLENGTTCASYFTAIDAGTTNLFADLLVEMGQRGYVGKVCMDHNEPCPAYSESLETCRKSMDSIISHISKVNPPREHLVEPIVTPRFAPVCSTPMLDYLGEISARDNLPIQTHISENKQEIELVAELFPDCESYAQVYNKHHLLTKRTILAHAIHLTQKECDLVAEKQCSISHCPTSNTFISSGEAPVYKYLYQDKINVSLGTDISGGFDVSILAMVKYAILVSHHLSMKPAQANGVDCKLSMTDGLYMATMGGARAVGLANLVGSFAVGKRFDAQLIDLDVQGARTDVFSWQVPKSGDLLPVKEKKMEDLLGKWIFSGDDRNCVSVWCNGRLVIDKRKPTKN